MRLEGGLPITEPLYTSTDISFVETESQIAAMQQNCYYQEIHKPVSPAFKQNTRQNYLCLATVERLQGTKSSRSAFVPFRLNTYL